VAARAQGLRVLGAVASPLPGPSGNVEYFLRLSRAGTDVGDDVLTAAVEEGP
jgi:23S rRNA (cytidine1920-2'-O)/16S rRNA (cytidine1409-2'-O)-methyltransferase